MKKSKKKNKKKIKRTPEQLRKIKEKRILREMGNKRKRELELQNKKTLMDNEYDENEKYFYHITTPDKLEMILKSKGLYGNVKSRNITHPRLSTKGWIYCTDSNDKEYWNGISTFTWDLNGQDEFDRYCREGKEYVVIGIKCSSVQKYNQEQDNGCGEIIDDSFRRIQTDLIPHKDLVFVGKYITRHQYFIEDYRYQVLQKRYPNGKLKIEKSKYPFYDKVTVTDKETGVHV
jgi:hypothetical protein